MITIMTGIVFYMFLSFLIIFLLKKHPLSLSRTEIFVTFGIKVTLGCLYGYIFSEFYNGDDTWAIHQSSLQEWQLLSEHPAQFFAEYTPVTAIRNANGEIRVIPLYLADLEYCLLNKTIAIFNLISRGSYYLNVLFFNFIVFWGHFWLFTLLAKCFPSKRTWLLCCVFFLPTAVFWLSGIRGDGFLFFFFSLLIYQTYLYLYKNKKTAIVYGFIGLIGVLIFRPPFALLILPAILSWWLIVKQSRRPLLAFSAVYGISILLFFGTTLISSRNGPALVVQRQSAYLELKAHTRYKLDTLKPTVTSFLSVLPQAFINTAARPWIWEAKGILQLLSSAGVLLFWSLACFCLIKPDREHFRGDALVVAAVLISIGISLYLFIGYTVPFPGAIVRYKCIGEMILIAAFIGFSRTPTIHIK